MCQCKKMDKYEVCVLDRGNGSANENSSSLDKVDGGEVVHQLEMILVQGGRNLFWKNIKNPKYLNEGNTRLTKGKRSVLGRRARAKGLCC